MSEGVGDGYSEVSISHKYNQFYLYHHHHDTDTDKNDSNDLFGLIDQSISSSGIGEMLLLWLVVMVVMTMMTSFSW